ncbi:hypothetical protein [Saccharothrix sp. HUAS TT1]|uniref:hypothetical protein n=1 Tax=unclassified Saccharothrix TaxID=2593673 RepID=UPI00345B85BF
MNVIADDTPDGQACRLTGPDPLYPASTFNLADGAATMRLDTPDEVEHFARTLERLAALVRTRGPATVKIATSRRIIDLPSADGYLDFEDGGLEHVAIEVRW